MHRTNFEGMNFSSSASKTCKPCIIGSPGSVIVLIDSWAKKWNYVQGPSERQYFHTITIYIEYRQCRVYLIGQVMCTEWTIFKCSYTLSITSSVVRVQCLCIVPWQFRCATSLVDCSEILCKFCGVVIIHTFCSIILWHWLLNYSSWKQITLILKGHRLPKLSKKYLWN